MDVEWVTKKSVPSTNYLGSYPDKKKEGIVKENNKRIKKKKKVKRQI